MSRRHFFCVATHCGLALALICAMLTVVCGGEVDRLQAAFKAGPTSGTAPLEVQFTDLSSGNVTGWKWDFNNDGTVDSTDQNPSHSYADPGAYSVSLEVTGPEGSDAKTKSEFIKVSEPSGATPTGAPSLRFDSGQSLSIETGPQIPYSDWVTYYPAYSETIGKKLTNDGGPGDVFVSVELDSGALLGSTVFHMDRGEIVLLFARRHHPESVVRISHTFASWSVTGRPAEPGDASQDGFGSVWVERTSWNLSKAVFTLTSSNVIGTGLSIRFTTTFTGSAKLLNPDGVITDDQGFGANDTKLGLEITDSVGTNPKPGQYTLRIEGTFGETVTSFPLDLSAGCANIIDFPLDWASAPEGDGRYCLEFSLINIENAGGLPFYANLVVLVIDDGEPYRCQSDGNWVGPGETPWISVGCFDPEVCREACELVRRNLKDLTMEDKRQAMEALQVKVWIDGNTIEAEGSIPLPDVSIASRSLT